MRFFNFYIIGALLIAIAIVIISPPEVLALDRLEPRDKNETIQREDNKNIRDLVEDTFGADHVMVDVARCESSFRQFDASGDVLENPDSGASGVYQLLPRVHEDIAEDFGYDIYTVEGNIGYAEDLYKADGLKPWSASSLCWDDGNIAEINSSSQSDAKSRSGKLQKRVEERRAELEAEDQASSNNVEEVISQRLIIGVDTPEVIELQKLLNQLGYMLADDGPGSPGEETSFFGSLTKAALQEFQCDQDIICRGSEYTTGYGMADAKTRAALNKAAADGSFSDTSRVTRRTRSGEEDYSTDQNDAKNQDDETKASTSNLAEQLAKIANMVANLEAQIQQN